jgi:hypothetical protein
MSVGLIIGLVTAHVIICVVYLFIFARLKLYLSLFPVVLFIPFLGIVILLILYVITRLKRKVKAYDKDGLFLETAKMDYLSEFDEEKERNIVPVEEALIINEKNVQRSLVMEIAKRDPEGYLENLKKALLSDDTETAHYAASSITELKRGYDRKLAESERIYRRNPASGIARREYIDVLNDILIADLAIDSIRDKHISALVSTLEYDIQNSEKPPHESFEMLIEYSLKAGDVHSAKKWQSKYQQLYYKSDRPIRLKLLIAYETKDTAMFSSTIDEVKRAKFPITQKTKSMLEFWGGEQLDEEQSV